MGKPHITRRAGGEYSTAELPNGIIETVWFPDDPSLSSHVIGRTVPESLFTIAQRHIAEHESR